MQAHRVARKHQRVQAPHGGATVDFVCPSTTRRCHRRFCWCLRTGGVHVHAPHSSLQAQAQGSRRRLHRGPRMDARGGGWLPTPRVRWVRGQPAPPRPRRAIRPPKESDKSGSTPSQAMSMESRPCLGTRLRPWSRTAQKAPSPDFNHTVHRTGTRRGNICPARVRLLKGLTSGCAPWDLPN